MDAGDTRYKVLKVDRIWQRRGGMKGQNSNCGPATGAMIIDYYHDHLGYNVRDNAYYGSWAALSNHLRIDMGTLAGGTTLRGYASGMYNHVLHTSSGSAWSSNEGLVQIGHSEDNLDFERNSKDDNQYLHQLSILMVRCMKHGQRCSCRRKS